MKKVIIIKDNDLIKEIMGSLNKHTQMLEKAFRVKIRLSSEGFLLEGQEIFEVELVEKILTRLIEIGNKKIPITEQLFNYILLQARKGNFEMVKNFSPEVICVTSRNKPILCKTEGQRRYVQAIKEHEITFVNGPAGTGKTYLAVALAVAYFREQKYDRIILTRPAVEAGEKLGFLPGDLQMKVDPYMRPLYDALYDLFGAETYQKLMEKNTIEVSPLAYMRGRTLEKSFIILDEAQNTTPEQMKMFLTRVGFDSKVVITGDSSQTDLLEKKQSGLQKVERILKNIEEIAFVKLTSTDVVRANVVQKIIEAYKEYEDKKRSGST